MHPKRQILAVGLMGLLAALTACQPADQASATPDSSALVQAITPIPTLAPRATATPNQVPESVIQISANSIPSATMTEVIAVPSETPTLTMAPIVVEPLPTDIPTETLVPSPVATLPRIDHYIFNRPFPRSDSLADYIDRTYPYGSTQAGARDVHLGVDYANPRNTRVLAVGTGTVVFAGKDDSTRVGPAYDYYGNVVIIQHDTPSPDGLPVYTLYGHLETITVKLGQYMTPGDPVGMVGDSGIAIGPHLHLEVRVGGDGLDYHTTRNPDLWIIPYPGYGTIAGYVHGVNGLPVSEQLVLIRTSSRQRETYTYGERVNGDAVWQENFTLGDLPSGSYDVIVSDNGNIRFQKTVSVREGQTTFVDVALDD